LSDSRLRSGDNIVLICPVMVAQVMRTAGISVPLLIVNKDFVSCLHIGTLQPDTCQVAEEFDLPVVLPS
jgi:hypothetical protein